MATVLYPEVNEIADALDRSVRLKIGIMNALDTILTFISCEGRWMYTKRQQALGSSDCLITNILVIFLTERSNPRCCLKVLETVRKLCHYNSNDRYSGNVENIKKLVASGACSMVVMILRLYVAEAIAAVSTYKWILRGLSEKYSGIDDCVKGEIGQFLYDEKINMEIAQYGCDVIRILGWCNTANTSFLVAAGACEAVVGAIQIHYTSSSFIVEGCEVRQ